MADRPPAPDPISGRPAPRPRLAYLTSEYPAVSHTFILREIAALRDQGFEVLPCSVRRTDPDTHHRGPAEKAAAAETFYVIAAARNPLVLVGAQIAALARPGRWWRALRLAIRTSPPGPRALLYQLFYFAEAAVLARHMTARGIGHLHNHFGMSSCNVAMLASALSDIPYSLTLHGPIVFFDAERWRLGDKIARARFVACISHFCRSQGMLFSDATHWDRLRLIHCGVDPARYDSGPRAQAGKRVLFVGRLAAMKGVPVLMDAMAEVLKTHPDAHLTLIGDGPERAGIEARARALGLTGSLTFAGFRNQDEVAKALAETDIFALPSFAEGVPVVLMEAMASRVPVVTTRIAGIPELVEDGVAGRVVPPGDPQAFAAALIALMDAPDTARAMGEAGRAAVVEGYNSPLEAARLGTLFDGSAPAGPPRPPLPQPRPAMPEAAAHPGAPDAAWGDPEAARLSRAAGLSPRRRKRL